MPTPKPFIYNSKLWQRARKAILERDRYACRICGADGGGSTLHVHHVDRNIANLAHTNLVTLCGACHRQVHNEDYWPGEWPDDIPPWGILE